MGREQRAREAAYNEANRVLGVLETRLEGNEKSLQDDRVAGFGLEIGDGQIAHS